MAGIEVIHKVKLKWQLIRVFHALLIAFGVTAILFSGLMRLQESIMFLWVLAAIVPALISILIFKPWNVSDAACAKWIDAQLKESQNSAYLLIQHELELTHLGLIQQHRVSNFLADHSHRLGWPQSLKPGLLYFILGLLIASALQFIPDQSLTQKTQASTTPVIFTPMDSSTISTEPIRIVEQQVKINYPTYTLKTALLSGDMNIRALENSALEWRLKLSEEPKSLHLQTLTAKKYEFVKTGTEYVLRGRLRENGFYKFVYQNQKEELFESELYSLETYPDNPPKVEINGLERFTLLEINEDKTISFLASLSDDYGLMSTAIIATVSKGSGESVKFREEKMAFDESLEKGEKKAILSKKINLDQLRMTPGDELYFYVEAYDNKQPAANRSRTDSYFISIRDTTEVQFSLAGSLGVDLMPEYFRSQRQIIIDTEKLIKYKAKLTKHDFNATSNELGFDQKSLRLKYGQFMGEEFETGIIGSPVPEEAIEEVGDHDHDHDHDNDHDHDHDHGEEEENLLDAYTHKHDHDNEHALVAEEEEEEDLLEEYKHVHDDPEETTLYTKSIKGKLRAAMTEMWDAELYLRLYQPEKSLPYQYRALKLIKEIKNHARIYVHRIGFDPPPIKEDRRLTGELKEVDNPLVTVATKKQESYPHINRAVNYIDSLVLNRSTKYDPLVFKRAGSELASLAVDRPGKYLNTLQILQSLNLKQIEVTKLDETFMKLQYELSQALPAQQSLFKQNGNTSDALTEAFLNELVND